MQLRRTIFTLLVLGSVAGCTPNDALLGGALRHNYALQVIDPDPQHNADDAAPGADGKLAAAAVDRYHKGTTKKPQAIKTTETDAGR